MLAWLDYDHKYSQLIDGWFDDEATAMTGIDSGWADYWQAVKDDAVNFPGCEDFCMVVCEDAVPFAVVCFGIYQNTMTISEILIDPDRRGLGKGTRILTDLVEMAKKHGSDQVDQITAVVYPQNLASQRAFQKAGFHLEKRTEDGVDLIFTYQL